MMETDQATDTLLTTTTALVTAQKYDSKPIRAYRLLATDSDGGPCLYHERQRMSERRFGYC